MSSIKRVLFWAMLSWAVAIGALVLPPRGAAAQTRLLRFPDIHRDQLLFCYAGDIWRASLAGGVATRLTAHPGLELFPKFSPDGRQVAFTGQYDGDEQVYVIPVQGGAPKQLTYYPARGPLAPRWGYDNQVCGWTPDGQQVLFRSLRDANGASVETALYRVSAQGNLPQKLPMPTAGAGDYSPDGGRLVYSPLFRDFRSWKRYQGGWAQDLYLYDLASNQAQRIAPSERTERDPMWIGQKIYFVSDRDGVLNLYAYDLTSEQVEQLTRHQTWDVRWASSDNRRRIVYELNGELRVYDVRSNQETEIAITVPHDGLAMRALRYSAADNIEDFQLSPEGKRALFVARGDIFTAPSEKGATRNLTNSSGAHDKWARWSPDGSHIAFISDMTGEDQVYLAPQDGSAPPRRLTDQFQGMLYAPEWSADGQRLALSDKDGKLYVVTVKTKEVREIARETRGLLRDYRWSPRGELLAFSLSDESEYESIYIWSGGDGQTYRVTGRYSDDSQPAWDPEGNYLFFLSRRQYAPQISSVEWNFAGNRQVGVFALALRKDVADPFGPESDEASIRATEAQAPAGKESPETSGEPAEGKQGQAKQQSEAAQLLSVDFQGLAERVVRVPVEPDNLSSLSAVKGYLVYVVEGASFDGRSSYQKPALQIFDMKQRKASPLAEGVSDFALSHDGAKALVRQDGAYQLIDVKPDAPDKKDLGTKGLMVDRVPAEEWREIFDEVWRRYRDFFYVKNLHGYDWQAIGDRYRAWLPYVAHRSDLNYVISEMIAELNVGHAYIAGGDYEIPERPKAGLPGVRFELDGETGRYRIAKIFRGQNEEPKYRAPLTEVGVNAEVGLYVLAIDGRPLKAPDNPYRLLQHKTDPVTLTVNSRPTMKGARDISYRPLEDEQALLYLDFVLHNLEKVSQASDGRVGYLHVPDMSEEGIYEFIKWYYPQIRKEGLIVDVRSNGGGNVSQWLIERLSRPLLGVWFGSTSEDAGTYPDAVFVGHMACLLNETSASDGDIFSHMFRQAGLGPLIGKRSWGGVVGISSRGPLLDGGTVYVPLVGMCSADGQWIIEGRGVEPDIEVQNDPLAVIQGRDPQLERAIEEVMKRIKADPRRLPPRPADPVKTLAP